MSERSNIMAKQPIAGGDKFIPTSEPSERIPVGTIPSAHKIPNNQWNPDEGLVSDNDPRPVNARPGEGQETNSGYSGFASKDKFANQGSKPY